MKRFMFKIAFALVIAVLLHVGVAHLPANKFDPYYLVMTKPQAPSLVLGTSRSAQGIDPAAFNALFVSQWQGPLFNFSLTNSTSPFGPVYTRAILQKLNPATTNGLFIVTVDPWSIGRMKTNEADNPTLFEEQNNFLAQTSCVTCEPNYEYLMEQYKYGWGQLFTKRPTWFTLHNNGWLELHVSMAADQVARRTNRRITQYQKKVGPARTQSEVRLKSLKKLIVHLKRHGDVVLVRLPTSATMVQIEHKTNPTFEQTMHALAKMQDVPYFSYVKLSNDYEYTDGNHLAASSSKKLSSQLAAQIKDHFKK